MWVVDSNNASSPANKSSPLPPPLPKRPENRQRSPDHLNHHVSMPPPPPLASSSREKFEGVRQKWEKLDHQYNTKQQQQHHQHQRSSHDSLDDGYRSREAAEADYRWVLKGYFIGGIWFGYFRGERKLYHGFLVEI